ncbi:tau 95 subunit of transcription factor TFIIIC [Dissophora globulifera]|uniref:Tau 95 subunit of transcription factor TFIIIC n=1 Tax=Dissophora globulifera TaxID=979702 RepID=A0A9P6RNN9_9FUNG|nr:tau 95 subunit of transcription factor TFIIIC [Dissophora globulifera]
MESQPTPQPLLAKVEQVPEARIFSIEFPGHIENVDRAKLAAYLGGPQLDLRFRRRDPFSIPIQGETVSTANFLMKATRRFKVKRQLGTKLSLPPFRAPTETDVPYDEDEEPEIHFEMIGMIPKTERFSGLADYQHIVDPKDTLVQVKSDLMNINYESLISLKVDNTDPVEDFASLQLLPPPTISKATVPIPFKYKARDREENAPKAKPGRKQKRKVAPRIAADGTENANFDSDNDLDPDP